MIKLFIVDDHAVLREGLKAVLSSEFDIVGDAESVDAALAGVMRTKPDVVLLDLGLKGRIGLDLVHELHRRDVRPRILVLSMFDQPRHVADAVRAGVHGYVLKGAPGSELIEAVRAVMAGRRYFTPAIADLAIEGLLSDAAADPLSSLSVRERQILELVVKGNSSSQVGALLHISPKTVDTYRSRLMQKLEVRDLTELVRFAVRHGLIDAE